MWGYGLILTFAYSLLISHFVMEIVCSGYQPTTSTNKQSLKQSTIHDRGAGREVMGRMMYLTSTNHSLNENGLVCRKPRQTRGITDFFLFGVYLGFSQLAAL